jgi:hypothetical protein
MSVLDYEQYFNVADAADWLDKLSSFLLAQGWTIVRDLRDVQWQITNGFIAGTEDFLEFTSNGYGSHTLHFRFRIHNKDNPVGNARIEMGMGYGDTTLDTSSSSHPVDRFFDGSVWTTSTFNAETQMSNQLMPQVYYFGFEQKFCCIVSVVSPEKVLYTRFGVDDLNDSSINYGDYVTTITGNANWITTDHSTPFADEPTNMRYKDGSKASVSSEIKYACTLNLPHSNSKLIPNAFYGSVLSRLIVKNEKSDLRTIGRNRLYMIDDVDSQWFELCRDHVYRIWFEGMAIGERFFIGAEEYIAFPTHNVSLSYHGLGFRIS